MFLKLICRVPESLRVRLFHQASNCLQVVIAQAQKGVTASVKLA